MSEVLRIKTLGRLDVRLDDEALSGLASRKAELLLVYLACNRRPHPREVLADLLWDDRTQRQAMANLRVLLSSLRKGVDPLVTITRSEAGISDGAQLWLDAAVLEAAVARLREGGDAVEEVTVAGIEQAVALYDGDFLAGTFVSEASGLEAWMVAERERLHRLAVEALQTVATWRLAQQENGAAIAAATRLVQIDGLAEAGHRLLMEALARNGQRGAALAQYEACRTLLVEELGVEPAPATQQLRERIAAGNLPDREPAPALPAADLQAPPIMQAPPFLQAEDRPEKREARYLERGDELQQLNGQLQQALGGAGRIVFVQGEAGAGKTTTVQALAREATADAPDLLVVAGDSSVLGETGAAYGPLRQMTAMLAGDVEDSWRAGQVDEEQVRRLWQAMPVFTRALLQRGPHLLDIFVDGQALVQRLGQAYARPTALQQALVERLAQPPAGDEVLQRADLHQEITAVLQALSQERPLLLIVDDLHWADQASLGLLFHLGRALASSRILLVGTYRPQEAGESLLKVVAEAKRLYGSVVVDLDAVTAAGGRAFVDHLLDSEENRLQPSFREALYERTGGHPLFTVELLRALQERGDLSQDAHGAWQQVGQVAWERMPAQIEGVIEARLGQLAGPQRALLQVAAVEGETFTAQVVARALGRDERQVIRELSGILDRQHRLVLAREMRRVDGQRLSRYRFRHQLFQAYLYDSLDEAERTYFQEDVGAALEALYAGQTGAVAAQLARHYAAAGLDEKAVGYFLQAGDAALFLLAFEEATQRYEQALHHLREADAYGRAGRLLMRLGLAYHNAGRFARANEAYDEGFRLLHQRTDVAQAALAPAPHALRIILPAELRPDPAYAMSGWSSVLVDQLFVGLVRYEEGWNVIPGAAQRWTMEEGGRRYLFYLRADARWSDGRPLTAHDFVYAWRRVLDPATKSPFAEVLYDIKGAQAYHQQAHPDPETVAIGAVDEHTLRVELRRPTGYFLHLLATPGYAPVPRHVVETQGTAWTDPAHMVGNGPFRMVSWEQGKSIELAPNERYGQPRSGNVERVVLFLLSYPPTADVEKRVEAMYGRDELDLVLPWSPPRIREHLRRRFPADFLTGPAVWTHYLGLNQRRPPFDDARVRKALALALDREALAKQLPIPQFVPETGGLLPPGMPGFAEDAGLRFAPQEARRLLAAAGYAGGKDFPAVRVLTPQFAGFSGIVPLITEQWRQHLDLSIGVDLVPLPVFERKMKDRSTLLYYLGVGASYPDASSFFVDALGARHPFFQDQRFDDLLAQARTIMDPAQREALYRQADNLLTQEAYVIPASYERPYLLVKPWVSLYSLSTLDFFHLENVVIEPH